MSWLSKTVKKISQSDVTKMAARAAAAYYTGGASEMLLQARAQALASRDDLAGQASDQYPQIAALVQGYRQRPQRVDVSPVESFSLDEGVDEGDDYYDEGDLE